MKLVRWSSMLHFYKEVLEVCCLFFLMVNVCVCVCVAVDNIWALVQGDWRLVIHFMVFVY